MASLAWKSNFRTGEESWFICLKLLWLKTCDLCLFCFTTSFRLNYWSGISHFIFWMKRCIRTQPKLKEWSFRNQNRGKKVPATICKNTCRNRCMSYFLNDSHSKTVIVLSYLSNMQSSSTYQNFEWLWKNHPPDLRRHSIVFHGNDNILTKEFLLQVRK